MADRVIRIGTLLRGYCHGAFGRDSYNDKRVEAFGADWVIVRESDGSGINLFRGSPEELAECTINCECMSCTGEYDHAT